MTMPGERDTSGISMDSTVEEDPKPISTPTGGISAGMLIDGQYRVARGLGQGGMGQVVLARDQVLDRDVAIKFLTPGAHLTDGALKRFLNEARTMARVHHENVVSIYSLGTVGLAPYIVMEYVQGCDLKAWMKAREPSIDEALGILRQVCRGVQAIHDVGAVHLDIKPKNILLGEGFRVVVGDLGLARFISAETSGLNGLAGTPTHMAPEVITGGANEGISPRADIYSLGVLAFQLMTGTKPFEGRTAAAVMAKQITDPPPRPTSRRPSLPAVFEEPILDALAKDPADRPMTAMSWFARLDAARSDSALEPPRILVADDDEDFRRFACEVLRETIRDVRLACVPNGKRALDVLDSEMHQVAVLDLDMPGANGLEVVAALQERPESKRPHIVVVTAVGSAADWNVLAQLGVDSFLMKPVTPGQLSRTVQRLLGLSGRSDTMETFR